MSRPAPGNDLRAVNRNGAVLDNLPFRVHGHNDAVRDDEGDNRRGPIARTTRQPRRDDAGRDQQTKLIERRS